MGILNSATGGATVAIVIKGVDNYSKEFDKAGTDLQKFASVAKIAGEAAAVAFGAFTVSAIKAGLQMKPMEESFRKLAKESDKFLNELNYATKGTINNFELMSNANKALLLGLDQNALPDLFKNAAIVGRAAGRTTSEAIEDITLGIGRQSRMILDNLGIIIKADDVYAQFALSIGKTTGELTAQERQMAFNQAAMLALQESADKLGGIIPEDAITDIQRLTKGFQDFKTAFGEAFVENFQVVLPNAEKDWTSFGKTMGDVVGMIAVAGISAFKIFQVMIISLSGTVTSILFANLKIAEEFINGVIWGINKVINGINKIRGVLGYAAIGNISDVDLTSRLESSLQSQAQKTKDLVSDINELSLQLNNTFKNLGQTQQITASDTAKVVENLTKEQELVKQLSGFKMIEKTGDIFNPKGFQKSSFQSDFAYEQAKRGAGIEITIENIYGTDPDEIAEALNNKLNLK